MMTHSGEWDEGCENAPQKPTDSETQGRAVNPPTGLAAGMAILGGDTTISSWNSQAEKITGYTFDQVQSLGLATIFEPSEVMQHILDKSGADVPTN